MICRNRVAVEFLIIIFPNVAAEAATLGWRPEPLRGIRLLHESATLDWRTEPLHGTRSAVKSALSNTRLLALYVTLH
jgi:hypothetical protein